MVIFLATGVEAGLDAIRTGAVATDFATGETNSGTDVVPRSTLAATFGAKTTLAEFFGATAGFWALKTGSAFAIRIPDSTVGTGYEIGLLARDGFPDGWIVFFITGREDIAADRVFATPGATSERASSLGVVDKSLEGLILIRASAI
jgi:hypothetical protein